MTVIRLLLVKYLLINDEPACLKIKNNREIMVAAPFKILAYH
jgi:hypothetical protein